MAASLFPATSTIEENRHHHNDGQQVDVHIRAARWQDGYVIDLCDDRWQAVVVSPRGWRMVAESPVLFTRTP